MGVRNLLVFLGHDERAARKMQLSIDLAAWLDASITALYAIEAPRLPAYYDGYVNNDALGQAADAERKRAADLEVEFKAACERAGVDGDWQQKGGRSVDAIADLYRYTDLIVMGQSAPDDSQRDLPEDVVMSAGKPLLVLPHSVPIETIGRRVIIAWNRTREATRAVTDSLPLLQKADEVVVYSINPPGMDHVPGSYLCDHLSRHGIEAEPKQTVAHDIDVANVLLSAAHDHNTDLIVMGAYGHSRLREHLLGGATRDVLLTMTRPVLMSH